MENTVVRKSKFTNHPLFMGFGMLALSILGQSFASLYTYYYIDILGLGLGLATAARVVMMVWDAINDPMAGYLSDKFKPKRFGKRRSWLIFASPLVIIGFILLFSPPNFVIADKIKLAIWMFIFLMFYETFITLHYVNYETVYPEIYTNDKIRSKAESFKVGCEMVGVLISAVLPMALYVAFGPKVMALITSGIFLIIYSLCLLSMKENRLRLEVIDEKKNIIKELKKTFKDKSFLAFNISNALAQTVNALLATLMLFYAKYSLGITEEEAIILMAISFAPVVFLVIGWNYFIIKTGVKRAWRFSLIFYAFMCVPLLFAKGLIMGSIAGFCVAIGMAGYLVTPGVMRGRIIDSDRERNGEDREGIISSVASFTRQLSGIISVFLFFIVGLFTGYKSGADVGNYPDITFRILMSLVPIGLLVVSFIVSFLCKDFNDKVQ